MRSFTRSLWRARLAATAVLGLAAGIASVPLAGTAAAATGGTLSIVAGTGTLGSATAPGPATSSKLWGPRAVAFDQLTGDFYIADTGNNVVEQVTPTGQLSIVAGVLGQSGAPRAGAATSSDLSGPTGLALDATDSNLYISDQSNEVIEKVNLSTGALSIVAGTGTAGAPVPGPATRSSLKQPEGIAVDSQGNLYIADSGNEVIEKVTPTGTLSIVAGEPGSYGVPTAGPATSSKLDSPGGVAVDSAGNLYIADSLNDVVEKVTSTGTLSILAGDPGHFGPSLAGPATSSMLNQPMDVALDPTTGDLYIADTDNYVIEQVTPSGTLSYVAGAPVPGTPKAGPAIGAELGDPWGLAVDPTSGDFYIADEGASVVEKVTMPTAQSISFTSTAPASPSTGDTYVPTATATSGLGVTFSLDPSSTASSCILMGGEVMFGGGGDCIIDANQAGNATYAAAPQVQQTINVVGDQTITLTTPAPVSATVGQTYTPGPTADSGLVVTLTIDPGSTAGACSLADGVVSFRAIGTCVLDANQAGDASFPPATQVQMTIPVTSPTTTSPTTPRPTTPRPTSPVSAPPVPTTPAPSTTGPTLHIPTGFGHADTTTVASQLPTQMRLNVTSAVSASVTVPAGSLAPGSTVAVVRQQGATAIASHLPPEFGQTASFAVTWDTPQGAIATPLAKPINVVVTGTALRRGDIIYTEAATGLKAVDVVHQSGSATVEVTTPGSEFLVAAPPVSRAPVRTAHDSVVAAAVQLSCVRGAICEGPATLSVARTTAGGVSHLAVAVAHVQVAAGKAPVVRFALTRMGKALVRAHEGRPFSVTLLVKTAFGNRLVERITLG